MRWLSLVVVLVVLGCSAPPSGADGGTGGGGASGGGSGGGATGGGSGGGAAGGGAGGGATGGGGGSGFNPCPNLPAPSGNTVTVSTVAQLTSALQNAVADTTILLDDGTYSFAQGEYVYIGTPRVTLRGKNGDASRVILDGNYNTGFGQSIVTIGASDVTLADVTIRRAYDHAIHVQPAFSSPAPITRILIYRVHVADPGQQGIKVNPDEPGFVNVIDQGIIACSTIELTAAGRGNIRDNCYTGGIDIHAAQGWDIRDNRIEGFWCPAGLSEHAIHCWKGCRNIAVARNVMVNNARGVGFGLGNGTQGRSYADDPCPGVTNYGAVGGAIRNNVVVVTDSALQASAAGFDTGIGLELACGDVKVVHNTVFSTQAPRSSSIEWRFAGTTATVLNNFTSHAQRARDGATATQAGNLTTATTGDFVDAAQSNLHLASGAVALGQGAAVPALVCDDDLDGDPRTAPRDVGADEVP